MKLLPNIYACLAVIFVALAIMGGVADARKVHHMEDPPQQLRAPRSAMGDEPDAPDAMHARLRRDAPQEAPEQIYQSDDVPEQIRVRRQVPDMPPPPEMPDSVPMPPGGK